jgi:hypothetical protein
MGKLKLIIAAILVVGLMSILAWQYTLNDGLRRDNEGLKQALVQLKQLSDGSPTASTDDALTQEQRDELLKLRAEVTGLREQTNQIGALKDANQKLQVSLREARAPRPSSSNKNEKKPEDALPQDIHPKDSWGFRGYATPDATVESVLWGMMNGDKDTISRAFSPDMLPEILKQMDKADFAEESKKMNNAEFRVLDRQQLSDDEMVLTLYMTRQDPNGNPLGSTEKTVFQRINGDWKVTKKSAPEN